MSTTQTNSLGKADPQAAIELAPEALPRHVAVIMDGNGRWAESRGKPRTFGHERGAATVRQIVTESAKLGLDVLTLYSFSTENWTRSRREIEFLMRLYVRYLIAERDELFENNIRLIQIGRRERLPKAVLAELDRTIEYTADRTGLTLAVAINYGSRSEITDAVRQIATQVKTGQLDPSAITEATISNNLYTAGLPDPDLLIRTAGEMRVSNYLLWQISYAELYVSGVCWPDFGVEEFHKALCAYAQRKRKFGDAR